MSFSNQLGNSVHNASLLIQKYSPLILTSASILTGVSATVSAVRATPQATDIIRYIQSENLPKDEETKKILLEVAPLYAEAVIFQGLSIGCSIGSYAIHQNRLNAATQALAGLSSLYLLKQEELKKTKEAIAEKFGEKAEEEIERTVAEKEAKEKEEKTKEIIIANDGPEEIMQDSISGQFFKNTRDRIYWLCNDLGHRLEFEDMIPASDYFIDAGISVFMEDEDEKYGKIGDQEGWLCGDRPWPKFIDFILPDGRKAVKVIIDTNPAFNGYKNYY